MSDENLSLTEEQMQAIGAGPEPDGPTKVTFFCAIEGRGSNQQITLGGHREKDSTGRVISASYKLIKFTEGIYRTEDEEEIKTLRRLAKDHGTGITEDREAYLDKVIPPERQVKRLEQQLAESRSNENRLRKMMSAGGKNETSPGAKAGPVSSGSVPRRSAGQ